MASMNYLIATYAGISPKREFYDKGLTSSILQKHLQQLIKLLPTTTMIKQVTIMRPRLANEKAYDIYYEIDDYVSTIEKTFGIPVKFIDMDNYTYGVSYSQYRKAFAEYPTFDFYIVMEDDWVPLQERFDELLLTEWKKQFQSVNDQGYLCLWYRHEHATISVGMISQSAFTRFILRFPLALELNQYDFSKAFEEIGIRVCDYSDHGKNWRILFWDSYCGKIFDYSTCKDSTECLLAPLHFLYKDELGFVIEPRG
jgi:hypothetical protein